MRYAVVIVSPPGYPHAEAFREVAESLVAALRDLGHDALLARGFEAGERRAIVFGANLLERAGIEPPPDAILYNLEQVTPDSPWFPAATLARASATRRATTASRAPSYTVTAAAGA